MEVNKLRHSIAHGFRKEMLEQIVAGEALPELPETHIEVALVDVNEQSSIEQIVLSKVSAHFTLEHTEDVAIGLLESVAQARVERALWKVLTHDLNMPTKQIASIILLLRERISDDTDSRGIDTRSSW